MKELGANKYNVKYIDYGNYETANKDAIGVLPENLKGIKSPLYRCLLYDIENITAEGLNIIKDHINVELTVEFKE